MQSQSQKSKSFLPFRKIFSMKAAPVVRESFLAAGWTEEVNETSEEWDLKWCARKFTSKAFQMLLGTGKAYNHLFESRKITYKDDLHRTMKYMKSKYGKKNIPLFSVSSSSSSIPSPPSRSTPQYWVVKGASSCQGKHVALISSPLEASYDRTSIAQKYVTNPMLCAGYKFDIRIYVVVLSFSPLRAFIYPDGIARFATEKYFHHSDDSSGSSQSPSGRSIHSHIPPESSHISSQSSSPDIIQSPSSPCSSSSSSTCFSSSSSSSDSFGSIITSSTHAHITNTSISAHSHTLSSFKEDLAKYDIELGKDSGRAKFSDVLRTLLPDSADQSNVWRKMKKVCALTLAAAAMVASTSESPSASSCLPSSITTPRGSRGKDIFTDSCWNFELLGFDLLIDDKMNIHLIEVNSSPSLSTEEGFDHDMKRKVVEGCIRLAQHRRESGNDWWKITNIFTDSCWNFELLGFDLLIDDKMNIHLIEVNSSPSLSTEEGFDHDMKRKVVEGCIRLAQHRRESGNDWWKITSSEIIEEKAKEKDHIIHEREEEGFERKSPDSSPLALFEGYELLWPLFPDYKGDNGVKEIISAYKKAVLE
ncbi:Tubulin-tyrosine ligase/Tubulin polyglutamylase like protein [Aduncisulcus paluster]|uniref:Tubulin-tyrosine ligase/Tubulin polyglutamylase like protein n=1 Tax=Aduncisulcus paluster TaxID=2918883 RepID=A0ABQ5K4Z0_9EUKA|nr:Tubulin-tyrosine ligase/Tubulin polyglutamylase like protein [Aduncisulcus paluster]